LRNAAGSASQKQWILLVPVCTPGEIWISEKGAGIMDAGRKLAVNAKAFPGKTAVIFKDRHTSYAQLNERSVRLANALISLGIEKRQKVATVMRNRAEYLEIIYSLVKAGITHVPVNWRLAPEEMIYVITNSESIA
jgi:acyl-CoA synthetase (AMP-forming)/AMP-acid ligase II